MKDFFHHSAALAGFTYGRELFEQAKVAYAAWQDASQLSQHELQLRDDQLLGFGRMLGFDVPSRDALGAVPIQCDARQADPMGGRHHQLRLRLTPKGGTRRNVSADVRSQSRSSGIAHRRLPATADDVRARLLKVAKAIAESRAQQASQAADAKAGTTINSYAPHIGDYVLFASLRDPDAWTELPCRMLHSAGAADSAVRI